MKKLEDVKLYTVLQYKKQHVLIHIQKYIQHFPKICLYHSPDLLQFCIKAVSIKAKLNYPYDRYTVTIIDIV